MEGVPRYKVRLLPHNPEWQEEYKIVKKELTSILNANIIQIEHVGSTAIPGIYAKPILDIAILLKQLTPNNIKSLENLGYEYCGHKNHNDDYHLFVMRSLENFSLRHLHIYISPSIEFQELVFFRDYLNQNPLARKKYQNLKQELAQKYPNNRELYTKGKEQFIKSIYKELPKN
ncbi:MAG: GrpB family protein [Bacilli bacterium]|nr:GrpB family protein [Bacilli bacterium]